MPARGYIEIGDLGAIDGKHPDFLGFQVKECNAGPIVGNQSAHAAEGSVGCLLGGTGGEDGLLNFAQHGETLVAPAQGFFGLLALGDVAGVDDDAADGRLINEIVSDRFQMEPRAVFMANAELDSAGGTGRAFVQGEEAAHAKGILWMDEVEDGVAGHLCWRIADHSFHGGGLVTDDAISADHRDDVCRILNERTEVGLPPL